MKFVKGQKFSIADETYAVDYRTNCYVVFECAGEMIKRKIAGGAVESCKPDGKTIVKASDYEREIPKHEPAIVTHRDKKGSAKIGFFQCSAHAVAWIMTKAKNISGEFRVQSV